MIDERAALGARNNAHLYEAVCRAHGVETEVVDGCLSVLGRPPRFFGSAVTLSPDAVVTPGPSPWGVKDSFMTLDPAGCVPLFDASWIWRAPSDRADLRHQWRRIESTDDLRIWLEGWAEGDVEAASHPVQFPDSMLERDDFAFFGRFIDGVCVAGFLLNDDGEAIGCSNEFQREATEGFFDGVAAVAAEWRSGRPVVGYLRGDELRSALEAGFVQVGTLRVWVTGAGA